MTYGFVINGPFGQKLLDSDSLPAVLKDVIYVSPGASGSKSYFDIPGYSLYVLQFASFFQVAGNFNPEVVSGYFVSYPGNIPSISWYDIGYGDATTNTGSWLFVYAK
jgi:hypothetical protein